VSKISKLKQQVITVLQQVIIGNAVKLITVLVQYSQCLVSVIKVITKTALSDGRTDKAQYIVRSHQGTTTGTERSSVLGGRRKEKARSERVVVERSKPARQPLGMTVH